jgi:ribosomal protein S18 acetylase RimI-like enzyme
LVQIRAAERVEAAMIAQVHDACWRAAYAEILPPIVLRSSLRADRERLWGRLLSVPPEQRCAFVVEDAAAIVGCAWGGPEESGDPCYRAELLGLYLSPTYQRRGFGRQLVATVAANLQRQGHQSLILWALAENVVARRFYEALGGQLVRERDTLLRDIPVPEVAYGWPDLGRLSACSNR